jgi:hypothetical protein
LTHSKTIPCPFLILIDSAEQQPFSFTNLRADAAKDHATFDVRTKWLSLGRHPTSLGDYSLEGGRGRCHVERKSMDDAHGTFLGWAGGRRERFESELANLSQIECGLVVVECSLAELINRAPQWGTKTAAENAKSLHRSILAWQQDYRVPWAFCDSRRLAEITTFRWLERWWRKQREAERAAAKKAKAEPVQGPPIVTGEEVPF